MQAEQDININLIQRIALGDVLRRRARSKPDHEVLISFPDNARHKLSFSELNSRVNQLAHGLRKMGLKSGCKVALLSSNQSDFMTVAFACFKSGFTLVPINFLLQHQDIKYNLEHAEVACVIYEAGFANTVQKSTENLKTLQSTIVLGQKATEHSRCLADLIADQPDSEIEDVIIEDRDTAIIMYTSGTTSRPKGVEISHLALYISTLGLSLNLSLKPELRQLIVLPMFHIAAMVTSLSAIQLGGTLVLLQQFIPERVLQLLEEEKVDTLTLLPMMWRTLLASPQIDNHDYSAFQVGVYGMAAMDQKTLTALRKTFGAPFHLGSGQTEFSPTPCIFYDETETEFAEGNYWGIPSLTADQAILDDQGNELPPGEVGEICWRGPQVMNGYYKNPEATDETRKFGWHHSGDLGLIDNKGQLLFIDRKKDMIKSGGENVASSQVEQALMQIPGVSQSAAFGVPHPYWGEAVCACVVLEKDCQFDSEKIIEISSETLAGFQVPKAVMIIPAMPLTATGKIKKTELKTTYIGVFQENNDTT